MINYYERCNAGDDNDASPVNPQDDQVFFPTQKTLSVQSGWPTNGTDCELNKNGRNSPASPGPYYSTITSSASKYEDGIFFRVFFRRSPFSNDFLFLLKFSEVETFDPEAFEKFIDVLFLKMGE